jgi:tRNA (guanine-N7-)-methyltransferase
VELGCGDGTFLRDYAQAHPELNFLGVERLLGRARKSDRKAQRAGLANVRVIRIEAGYAMEYLLPHGSASALHVYFPDPWPKRRHWDRRLVNAHFMQAAWQALVPGGLIYFRTDDAPYFAQMLEVAQNQGRFSPVETPAELASIQTDFERVFAGQGTTINRAAYERHAGQSSGQNVPEVAQKLY